MAAFNAVFGKLQRRRQADEGPRLQLQLSPSPASLVQSSFRKPHRAGMEAKAMAAGFEQALKEYQAGRLAEAMRLAQGVLAEGELGRAGTLRPHRQYPVQVRQSRRCCRGLARAAEKADDSAAAAYLKLAVTLAQAAGLFDLIASIGPRAVRLHPDAPDLTLPWPAPCFAPAGSPRWSCCWKGSTAATTGTWR